MRRWIATCCSLCLALGTAAAAGPDLDYLARLVDEAHVARAIVPDFSRINPALDDEQLYAVQARFVAARRARGTPLAGFKGGFAPRAPVGGVLFADGWREAPAAIDAGDFHTLLVEAEIAFEFCVRVAVALPDVRALREAVCRLRPAVELPDAALHDLPQLMGDWPALRRNLIPTAMGSRMFVLGTPRSAAAIDVDRLAVVIRRGPERLGARDLGAPADLWASVLWVVNGFVIPRGYAIEPGQIVLPGSLTGIHPGTPGRYRVDYGALGTLEFEIRAPASARAAP